ncbi:MAG: YdcF family protein [Lachnospiraceae bacterium]|nr:YdcF family protein [Lachnospiraceae bacterium]
MIKIIMLAASFVIAVAGMITAHMLLKKVKKHTFFDVLMVYVYTPAAIWSVVYFFVCVSYAGLRLSWVWLWPLIAAFCIVRIIMLKARLEESVHLRVPKALTVIYRICFAAGLVFFLYIESLVVKGMTAVPPDGLEYVIVLGAGLKGDEPTNTLRARIIKGAEYMKANPDTVLIASGGQGADELISEAECIRRQLTGVYGIDDSRILLEDRSTSTIENLKYSMEIIGDPHASTGIITNSFHEYRAMCIAQNAGYKNVSKVPATTLLPVGIHYVVREFFGVVEFMLKQ